jgi:3-hydroxybutyryl-CoA dehydrogenase
VPRAAVIGSGTMGTGFVQLLTLAGYEVGVADRSPEHAEAGVERAVAQAHRFEAAGLMAAGAGRAVEAGARPAEDVASAVEGSQVVLEAVAEDPGVKAIVLRAIEDAASDDCTVATNTSAIPIGDLAAGLRRPERFLGAHWFNPAQWIPCVEVIPHETTADVHVTRVVALLEALGKQPTIVRDTAGFVANRIQMAMFKEAAAVVADGIATADDVDRIVRGSFGFRLPFFGPFAIADMAGLDVYAGAYAALERSLGPRFAVPESVRDHVDAGRFGTKAGGGYVDIAPEDLPRILADRDASYVALTRLLET